MSERHGSHDAVAGPSMSWLAVNKPAALLSRMSEPAVLFLAGAAAGALGKTMTAPLDRLKLIMQVRGKMAGGAVQQAAQHGNIVKAFMAIGKQSGLRGYWQGNLPQVLRVIPYSAAQLCSYELFKHTFAAADGSLNVERKLAAGACAGMVSTLATYPLDTLRMRLALDPTLRTIPRAIAALLREGGPIAFYRGLGPAVLGIAPYMALELATYDTLPQEVPSFARGFTAALLASSFFYPLDTVRRQIQLQSTAAKPIGQVLQSMYSKEGLMGFYRGFLPNALKNLPNKGVRLSVFTQAKCALISSHVAHSEALQQWHREQSGSGGPPAGSCKPPKQASSQQGTSRGEAQTLHDSKVLDRRRHSVPSAQLHGSHERPDLISASSPLRQEV